MSRLKTKDTAVRSPIRTPRKIARIGLSFSKVSKPDLKFGVNLQTIAAQTKNFSCFILQRRTSLNF
jgi:hypothetical protein